MRPGAWRCLWCAVVALVVLLAFPASSPVATTATGPAASPGRSDRIQETSLQEWLEDRLRAQPAVYGVVAQHLETGEAAAVRAERRYESASLYKLAVLYEVYRQQRQGELTWGAPLMVTPRHLRLELVSPWAFVGRTLSVAEATELMITRSDNTAGALLWTRVGQNQINRGMAELGLGATRLDWDSYTTPADMARFFWLAHQGALVDPEASAAMLELLARQQVNDRLPYLLPRGTRVAHKTGDLPGLTHDVGLVYAPAGPFVLAVLTEWSGRAMPHAAIARLARDVYDYFEERYGLTSPPSTATEPAGTPPSDPEPDTPRTPR